MGNFKHGGGRFDRRNRDNSNFRGRSSSDMHQVICDQCGKSCEVPFRPTEGKPVYCNECFGNKRDDNRNKGGDRFQQKHTDGGLKDQLIFLNQKMDKLIAVLELMAGNKKAIPQKEARNPIKTDSKAKEDKSKKKVVKKKK